ncbi:MAG: Mth938-like domain-containing protein [Chromatiaceae bacterium]
MKFSETGNSGRHLVQGYGSGRVQIRGKTYTEGLIVSPDEVIAGWGPERAADLAPEHVTALTALEPQVIVIGTGARQIFPEPRVYASALAMGIGVEIMDTGAACRTYNVLAAEGRKVTAGLIMR